MIVSEKDSTWKKIKWYIVCFVGSIIILVLLGGAVFMVLSNMLVVRLDKKREKRTIVAKATETVAIADGGDIENETSDTN